MENELQPLPPARVAFERILNEIPVGRAVYPGDLKVPYTAYEVRAVLRILARYGHVEIVPTNIGRKYRRRIDV